MLTLDPVVQVNVTVASAAVAATSYDVGLIVTAATETFTTAIRAKVYSSVQAVADDGFATNGNVYKAASKYFGTNPAPQNLVIGVIGNGEQVAAAMNAIRDVNGDWYGVYFDGATDANKTALDEWLSAEDYGMQFTTVTGNTVDLTIAGTVVAALAGRGTRRTCMLYSADATEAAAMMGIAMGCSGAYGDRAWQLCYKTVDGITPVALTQADVDKLLTANISVYLTRRYTQNVLERGSTPSTLRVDEVIALDKLASEMQNACFDLMASADRKLPQTDDTSTQFISAIAGVLERYRNMGYIQPDIWRGVSFGNIETGDALEKGYSIWVDSFDHQTEADRRARKSMPIYVGICFCGSVEFVMINVNVQE